MLDGAQTGLSLVSQEVCIYVYTVLQCFEQLERQRPARSTAWMCVRHSANLAVHNAKPCA